MRFSGTLLWRHTAACAAVLRRGVLGIACDSPHGMLSPRRGEDFDRMWLNPLYRALAFRSTALETYRSPRHCPAEQCPGRRVQFLPTVCFRHRNAGRPSCLHAKTRPCRFGRARFLFSGKSSCESGRAEAVQRLSFPSQRRFESEQFRGYFSGFREKSAFMPPNPNLQRLSGGFRRFKRARISNRWRFR